MGLSVEDAGDGTWKVVDDGGRVLATAGSNAAAWREAERLEVRKPGRLSGLFRSDKAMTIRGKD